VSTRVIEYRDVRPSGAVLSSWECEEGREYGNDYSQFGPGMTPEPPYERQRREPGGEWVTVVIFQEDGTIDITPLTEILRSRQLDDMRH
jgi:hypothetical protein